MYPSETKRISFPKLWEELIGSQLSFSMENRLFNTVSIFTLVALVIAFISNIALEISGLFVVATFILQCILYYFSRVKKQYTIPAIIYCFASYGYFIANYYMNGGIEGPTVFGFISTFILIIALGPLSWHRLWVVLHIIIVLSLLGLEYFNIGRYETYATRKEHFTDISISYIISLTIMYFVVVYIRNNYLKEKRLAQEYAASIVKKNEELEELNQLKNMLFSIISHDLRAPLNSVQGYLELLIEDALPEKERNKIKEQLLHLTKHTQEMLFNLLSWSKSQISGNAAELAPINVASILESTIAFLRDTALKKGLVLKCVIDPELLLMAEADMLQLIVRNLITNAIKFSYAGGEIAIKAYRSGVEGFVSVTDSGIGISLEKQREVFSSKLKSAYGTNKERGTGLGLYLCKELIELQDGKIWFTSQQGQGSEFTISLPVC